MSRRNHPGSGRRYEEFLDGSRSDDSALSAMLDAARAPGTRDEMAGLPAARTAFMSAPYLRTRPAASVSKLPAATKSAAGRLLALKFVAAVSGATLIGGAAYAATGAKLLPGSSSPHKHSTTTSAAAPGGNHPDGYRGPTGAAQPTPAGPVPATSHGDPNAGSNGKSSEAHAQHSPSTPPGQSNTPPGRQTSHTPKQHHTPTPHDTKPHHSPSPHSSSPGHGQTKHPAPSPSDSIEP
jgi:hypothetical protein